MTKQSIGALLVISALLLASACGPAARKDEGSNGSVPQNPVPKNAVVYDHAGCQRTDERARDPECSLRRRMVLRDGEPFSIVIENTNPDAFDYIIQGIERVEPDSTLRGQGLRKPLQTVTLRRTHDRRYGGYIVTIRRKPEANSVLSPTSLEIEVRTEQWEVAFGGGFTVSELTNPSYALRDSVLKVGADGTEETGRKLVEQKSRNDDARRGIATFVHVWNTRRSWLGFSFGLGLDQEQGNEYYGGVSWRLGEKATLTAGGVLGPVAAPPSGVDVDDVVTDENILNNLGTRTKAGGFIGISYSFLGGGARDLNKPFLGEAAQATLPPPRVPSTPQRDEAPADSLAITGTGNNQSAAAGTALQNRLVVIVTDGTGKPQPDIPVSWTVSAGGGTITPDHTKTQTDGKASAVVRMGPAMTEQKFLATFSALGKVCEFTAFIGQPKSTAPEPDCQ